MQSIPLSRCEDNTHKGAKGHPTGLFSFKNFQFVSLTVSPIDRIDFAYQITPL